MEFPLQQPGRSPPPAQNKKPDGCNDPPGSRVCSGCWVSELSGAQSVTRFGWPNGLQVSSGAVVRGLTQTDHYRYSQIPRSSVCGDTVKTFAEQVMPAQPQRYFSVVEVCLPTTTSNVRLFAMQLSDCRRMPLQQELNVACRLVANMCLRWRHFLRPPSVELVKVCARRGYLSTPSKANTTKGIHRHRTLG